MKKRENEGEVLNEEVTEAVKADEAQQSEAAVETEESYDEDAELAASHISLHDVLMHQAMSENKDKLFSEVKKVMMQQMIVRAGLERQMALLDAQISGIDYKLEQLSALVESGQIIEAAEVRTFMDGGELVGIAIVNITDEVKANRKRRTDLRL